MAKSEHISMQPAEEQDLTSGSSPSVESTYSLELIQTIDEYQNKLKVQRMDRRKIHNRLRLLQMREQIVKNGKLAEIEQELRSMSVDIEAPNLRIQRQISIVIVSYTFFVIVSFVLLTVTNRIMLPGFNIPYSVLLMGLVGSLVSMFVKLPNIRVRQPLSYDVTIWFVINPLVAVVMAGIFFGIAQIFMQLFPFQLMDESWPFWILAWVVGLINWVSFYEKIGGIGKKQTNKPAFAGVDDMQSIIKEKPGKN